MSYQIVSDAFKNLSTNLRMHLKESPQSFILTGEIQPKDLRFITLKLAGQFSDELQDTLVICQQDGVPIKNLIHLLTELEDDPFQTLLDKSVYTKEPLEDQHTLLKLIKQHLFQSEQKFDQLFFAKDSLSTLKQHQTTLQKLMRCLIKQFDRIIIMVEPAVLQKIGALFPFIHGTFLITDIEFSRNQVSKSIRRVHTHTPVLGLILFG